MSAISIVNAKKKFGTLEALKGINLQVKKGEFFGLLGPNGAGKTTLIHSIVGLCHLSEGTISVFEHDVRIRPRAAHALTGFSPQDINLDRYFSIRKILIYQAGFFGLERKERQATVDKLLNQFHLTEKAHLPYYRLSGGMQKRLLIAKAMVSSPRLLILDEPTAGIDVEQRFELWNYLRRLNQDGTTILLTTHYIDEAEALCQKIGIIHLGEIREVGTPGDLINRYCEKSVILNTSRQIDISKLNGGFQVEAHGNEIRAKGRSVGEMINMLHRIISQDPDCQILDVHVERGTLEDVFLKVTGSRMVNGGPQDPEAKKRTDESLPIKS